MSLRPPTTPEQIDVWRSSESETESLEFKEAKEQYDSTKLYEYCVAIANEGGGTLLLGIQNNPPRRVSGTKVARDPNKFAQQMLERLKFRVDVEVVAHPDGRVVVFHIPSRPQ